MHDGRHPMPMAMADPEAADPRARGHRLRERPIVLAVRARSDVICTVAGMMFAATRA
jgi:hypothetical protein